MKEGQNHKMTKELIVFNASLAILDRRSRKNEERHHEGQSLMKDLGRKWDFSKP